MPGDTRALVPRDAATLIILRHDKGEPRMLMGKRSAAHAFMPNKFVFPGGRVDAADSRVLPGRDLHPAVAEKLLSRMRGKPSPNRARALAMAAVRETFEEVGLIAGQTIATANRTRSATWRDFLETGYAPDLGGLRLFARAITPPGRPRRFDSRFFVMDADHLVNVDTPVKISTQELLDPYWVTFDEAAELDLPRITGEILGRLRKAVATPGALEPGATCTYQYTRHKVWQYEHL